MVNSQFVLADVVDSHDKRVCQRIELNKTVQLTLSDGRHIAGVTKDISLGGLRIAINQATDMDIINAAESAAILQVQFSDGQLSTEFPCSIVRCDVATVCLQLDKKKSATFGMMMTRGAFKQKTSKH